MESAAFDLVSILPC